MKKDRPGAVVSALCRPADRARLERLVIDHSPTLGVRWSRLERAECARDEITVEHRGARVRAKLRRRPGGAIEPYDVSPEYDDLAELARATGRPLRDLEREVVQRALDALSR